MTVLIDMKIENEWPFDHHIKLTNLDNYRDLFYKLTPASETWDESSGESLWNV